MRMLRRAMDLADTRRCKDACGVLISMVGAGVRPSWAPILHHFTYGRLIDNLLCPAIKIIALHPFSRS
jgi:hypothetical protein